MNASGFYAQLGFPRLGFGVQGSVDGGIGRSEVRGHCGTIEAQLPVCFPLLTLGLIRLKRF